MKPNKLTTLTRPVALPAYGLAFLSAAVSMAQGGVWVSLAIFGFSILAATAVEVLKLRT
jgi:hypothetical protein